MPDMTPPASGDGFSQVLQAELRRPLFLSQDEIRGEWRTVLPGLAGCMPAPYPVFAPGDERILGWGYPIRLSEGTMRLRQETERLVEAEARLRLLASPDSTDRDKVEAVRDRYCRNLGAIFGNALLNDWGRGLPEVFLLAHSSEIQHAMGVIARVARSQPGASSADQERLRRQVAVAVGEQVQRAWSGAIDALRRLAGVVDVIGRTTMVDLLLADPVLLMDSRAPTTVHGIDGFLRRRYRLGSHEVSSVLTSATDNLRVQIRRRPYLLGVIRHLCGRAFDPERDAALLEPKLVRLILEAELYPELGLETGYLTVLREAGLRLKSLELLAALRRRMLAVEPTEGGWAWRSRDGLQPIARSTRPFDFARPGIVDSSIHRFGLIYDLTNFTQLLEEVRKGGRKEEEKALQFMYIFQRHTEEVRERRRLNFEKFLGDGAFLSSRRALPSLIAACEIQRVYDRLRGRGFPFDQGIRIAVNAAEYRLLPMRSVPGSDASFEFFGHGIVELARLTTGKSHRDVQAMSEKLVHAGYDPREVEAFFAPLAAVRGGGRRPTRRPYLAVLDEQGELINEGIVVTLPFLEVLDDELPHVEAGEAEYDGLRWCVLQLAPGEPEPWTVGLRLLGVARLKGLPPTELVEVLSWPEDEPMGSPLPSGGSLVQHLRHLVGSEIEGLEEEDEDAESFEIPPDLVAVTVGEDRDRQHWVFGIHRASDDVLTSAVPVPLTVPELGPAEPVEMWLFRNRRELTEMYRSLRRENPGITAPMTKFRGSAGFQAFYLAAPHRSP